MSKVTSFIITLILATGVENCIADESVGEARNIAQTVCAACHGLDGNSALSMNPIIAGQHTSYIYKQLNNFKSGKRQNAVMAGIAGILTDEDMTILSKYFSQFKSNVIGTNDLELAEKGEKIYRAGIKSKGVPSCSGCHLPNGAGIPGLYPRLAGQYSEYTANQLRYFKNGTRKNDSAAIMRTLASRLSENEIKALAEYISALY